MATTSPLLGVPYIIEGQDEKELAHSEGANLFEAAVQLSVINRTLADPDTLGSPTADVFSNGDRYLIPTGAGDWASKDNQIAAYYDGFIYLTPIEGWLCWVQAEDRMLLYDGAAWVAFLPTVDLVEVRSGTVEAPTNKTFVIDESAAYIYDINTLICVLASGDLTVSLEINGVPVEGIELKAIAAVQQTFTGTAGSPGDNTVHVGDRVTLEFTLAEGSPSPIDFSYTVKTTRV